MTPDAMGRLSEPLAELMRVFRSRARGKASARWIDQQEARLQRMERELQEQRERKQRDST